MLHHCVRVRTRRPWNNGKSGFGCTWRTASTVILTTQVLVALALDGEVLNTMYRMSENGWIDQELFFNWLKDLFLKHIPPERPVMLVMVDQSSHCISEALHGASQKGVIVFCIPSNTTHPTQPLDVSLFGPFKCHWSSVYHAYLTKILGL